MATSTYPTMTGAIGLTEADKFIPELWSDEIIAAYKKNLVLANLVNKMSMVGKKGDTLHIPKPTRGLAHVKAQNAAVTIQNAVEDDIVVQITKHYEYSRLIEDIVAVQALDSMRRFYTDDAGYALAKQIDDDVFLLGQQLGNAGTSGADWTHTNVYYSNAALGIATYAADTVEDTDLFTDLAFRQLIKLMDDQDTPMDNRVLVIPPAARETILGIDRYVSSDFVNGRGVNNGQIGSLYGVDIYVTSNCPVIETAGDNTATTSTRDLKAAMLFHKDTFVLAEQMGIRSQTQYKQEFLANLYTADTLYGVEVLRPETGFVLALPA
jgi:N4-gp56 family major capsid protein